MPRLRSRLYSLEHHANPPAPMLPRFLTQHLHPDGRLMPTANEVEREAARLRAEGFRPIIVRTVYTAHALANGHGPETWQTPRTDA